MYTEEDLRDFVSYANGYLSKQNRKDLDAGECKSLNDLINIIVTLRYNAMVFETYIDSMSAKDYLLNRDLESLPLHINDSGLLSSVIIKWRLNRNK